MNKLEIRARLNNMLDQALEDAKDEMKLTDDEEESKSLQEDIRVASTCSDEEMNKLVEKVIEYDASDDAFIEAFEEYMGWD